MRTLISISIVVVLSIVYFNYTDKNEVTTKQQVANNIKDTIQEPTYIQGDDLGCTEEVELDDVLNLKTFNAKNLKLIKSKEFLGEPYVKTITHKHTFKTFDISTERYAKRMYKNDYYLVISYNMLNTSESKTLVCDYEKKTCDVYQNFFVTDSFGPHELEILTYDYDTTHVHDITYMGDYTLIYFNLGDRTSQIKY
jgi:hypothetical protein